MTKELIDRITDDVYSLGDDLKLVINHEEMPDGSLAYGFAIKDELEKAVIQVDCPDLAAAINLLAAVQKAFLEYTV